VEARIVGTDEDSIVSEPALDVVFGGVRNVAAWTQPRHPSLRATVQWALEGASPRYLALVPGQAPQVMVGQLDNPSVTFSCSAGDWRASRAVG
jgi:hypothetical protein